jgi:hypothetical protein
MLYALPFATFGEAAALGLEAHVYCPRCYTKRQVDPTADRLRGRCFARARFRCISVRWTGEMCGGQGSVAIRPTELLPVGSDVQLAFLWCDRCLPPWAINHIPIERPPWSVVEWRASDRFRWPRCRGAVGWHIHGPTWRPFPNDRKRGIDGRGKDDAGPS